MTPTLSFDRVRLILVATVTHLPDVRTRPNRIYEMADAALGSFAVFSVQSPSFLAHQQELQRRQGQNNARSLFGPDQVPSDGQIRNLLDPAPQFVRPQDGCEKQDCELHAAERWLQRNAQRFPAGRVTLLGDDLSCHQPFCELVLAQHWHFVFTCKPGSHPALYQEIELLTKAGGVYAVSQWRWTGQRHEVWRYRYALRVPLRADTHPLYVNWCKVTITDEATGELTNPTAAGGRQVPPAKPSFMMCRP